MTLDKSALFASRLDTQDVEVGALGTVKIRALSRAEVLAFRKLKVDDVAHMERVLLATSLVEPVLTEDEVKQWQDASPAGELEPVTQAINALSGLDSAAAKEAVQRFRGRPGA